MRLFLRLNLFYGSLGLLIWVGYQLVPDLNRYLPLGVIENLFDQGMPGDLNGVVIHASNVTSQVSGLVWLVAAIFGAVILMIPVMWTYITIRRESKLDQSLLQTMLIIPIAVTGIVLIVHNSLALAFSLAGVVAGIRFRYALKNPADSLFLFLAIGVGLACGIGMFVVAAVMTAIFNYTFLVLWQMNYGWNQESKRYMSHSPRGRLTPVELEEMAQKDIQSKLNQQMHEQLMKEQKK
ncbi:MAG: DUF4956 domain-containing protein [Proteobacteria bacterium]|nr:DUF4956 domain-containing protein [Pseudomonadota bacterium]